MRPKVYSIIKTLATAASLLLVVACAQDDSTNVRRSMGGNNTPDSSRAIMDADDLGLNAGLPQSNATTTPLDVDEKVFVQGARDYKFEEFKLPEVIVQRQSRRGEAPVAASKPYDMHEARLVIDLDKDEMRLSLDVEASRQREKIQLKGQFDRHSRPWTANLYAVDENIKRERRVQAVVLCLRPFICDQLWMDLYYVVGGELKRRQFVVGAEKPRVSLSEELSVPLPEPNSSGLLELPAWPRIEEASPRSDSSAYPPLDTETDSEDEADAEEETSENLPPVENEEEQRQAHIDQMERQEARQQQQQSGGGATTTSDSDSDVDASAEEEPAAEPVSPPMPRPADERPQEPASQEEAAVEKTPPPMPRPRPNIVHIDDVTIEYETEITLPPPEPSNYQVHGASSLNLQLSGRWTPQAIGKHTGGYLENASLMEPTGCGIKRRDLPSTPISKAADDTTASWGTGLMLEMLTQAACAVDRQVPEGHPLLVGNIARRRGGKFGRHSSHQTGLDADLGFYHRNRSVTQFWRPLDGNFEQNFDYERNWTFLKALQSTEEQRLMIVFVDQGIKNKICKWVKNNEGLPTDPNSPAYKALRYLRHWDGHATHFHVRLYCPGTQGCQNWNADPNFAGTGCS